MKVPTSVPQSGEGTLTQSLCEKRPLLQQRSSVCNVLKPATQRLKLMPGTEILSIYWQQKVNQRMKTKIKMEDSPAWFLEHHSQMLWSNKPWGNIGTVSKMKDYRALTCPCNECCVHIRLVESYTENIWASKIIFICSVVVAILVPGYERDKVREVTYYLPDLVTIVFSCLSTILC